MDSPIEVTDIQLTDTLQKLSSSVDPPLQTQSEGIHLPPIAEVTALSAISTSSLIQSMGLANEDEKSLGQLLKTLHSDLLSALEEVKSVTTHDNNLEKQYRETVEENVRLKAALYRARREITHLKGHLSVLELTAPEIREQRNRQLLQHKKRQQLESQLQERTQRKDIQHMIPVMSFQERSRTVNAQGQYIDHLAPKKHQRHKTFPLPSVPATSPKKETLPPVLTGCQCSVCNSQQSLGAVTLSKTAKKASPHLTKSGQQILNGDRVIVQGNQLGTVKYIGKLEFDPLDRIFIGVQLDAPVGITDGAVRGQRYFQCLPGHGVFVLPHNVLCVTGRKPRSSGTAIPRTRQKPVLAKRSGLSSQTSSVQPHQSPIPSQTPNSLLAAESTVRKELQQLLYEGHKVEELVDPSVSNMARRMIQLRTQPRPPPPLSPQVLIEPKTSLSEEEGRDPQESDKGGLAVEENSHPEEKISEEVIETTDAKEKEPPLLDVLLNALKEKDIGNSGFVTIKELTSVLTSAIQLTNEEIKIIFDNLGLQNAEGRGIEYESMTPYIVETIGQLKQFI